MASWALLALACSAERRPVKTSEDDDQTNVRDASVRDGRAPKEVEEDECPEDNPFCRNDAPVATPKCASADIDLAPIGVNVMVAIDGSAAMQPHWAQMQKVLESLRREHPDSALGVHVFWGQLTDNLDSILQSSNVCGETQQRLLELGTHSESELRSFLGTSPPGPSGALWDTSPVIDPLNYYLTHASKLADPKRTNYLVFVTSGNDNCFGSMYTNNADKLLAFEKLAVELGKLGIRLIPVGFDPRANQPTGLFGNRNPVTTRADVLEVLTKFGGSGLDEPPNVEDVAELERVIAQVGKRIRSCRFAVPAALDPAQALNPFELAFSINGQPVPRDRTRENGWNFVDGDTSQVELFGAACEAVRSGAELTSSESCAEDICGTASLKVGTKPRAVLYVLDNSASRIECVDGSLDCLQWRGPDIPRTLTFWEVVEHALGKSLVAPINDDVEFGIQFFPAKAAGALSCAAAPEPEIAPAQGTEIDILSAMLQQLPFGRTPLVETMRSIANNPGRLAGPDVSGAVVVLTDGGDSCVTLSQAEIVSSLGEAARTLHERGVETYVVRFGLPTSKSPEQDEQLRAIVTNGGTASSDAADLTKTPYIEALDEAALNAALAQISDVLATCSFTLDGVDESADLDRVNLYLNGEVIPFDQSGEQKDGWSFRDRAALEIELYGEACKSFKTNRKTSIVVEFGCAPITFI